MGYHIILKNNKEGIETDYVNNLEDLVEIDGLTKETIIYQGEKDWKPCRMDSAHYEKYIDERFKAGLRAQNLFAKLCKDNKIICQAIDQSQEDFKQYTA